MKMNNWTAVIAGLIGIIIICTISFFATSGLLWIICKLLSVTWFSWRAVSQVWLISLVVSSIVYLGFNNIYD